MRFVDFVVPVYRVRPYLRSCLESILRLSEDCQVILVDDGDPDDSVQAVSDLLENKNTLVMRQQNQGQGPARNAGLEKVEALYTWFVDSDDVIVPQNFPALKQQIADEQYPDMISFGASQIDENGKILGDWYRPNKNGRISQQEAVKSYTFSACSKLYRTSFLKESRIQFPAGFYEEIPVHFSSILRANSFAVSTLMLYQYRQRPKSTMCDRTEKTMAILKQVEDSLTILDHNHYSSIFPEGVRILTDQKIIFKKIWKEIDAPWARVAIRKMDRLFLDFGIRHPLTCIRGLVKRSYLDLRDCAISAVRKYAKFLLRRK